MGLKLNVRYNLHKPSAEEPTPIYLIYHYKNKRLPYSTGEKILPRYWLNDKIVQRARLGSELPSELPQEIRKKISEENKLINHKLANIEGALRVELQNYNKANTIPEVADLQKFLDNLLGKKIKPVVVLKSDNKSLLDYYTDFIEDMQKGKRVNKKGSAQGRTMVQGYIKSHGTTINNIRHYQKLYNKDKALKFDDITMDWYYQFVQMLKENNKAINTIGSQIKNIKTFLKHTYDKKLHQNIVYLNPDFITFKEETDHIYLTEIELDKIYTLNLLDNRRLENVRDLFILACNTGLRYSDFSKLKKSDFTPHKDFYILNVTTQKTSTKISIPLKKIVIEIMQKYNWQLPTAISNQKMNEYLKEIGKLAGIDDDVELSKTYNNQRIGNIKPKFEFITCHTARRSLATNMYLSGFDESEIMSITGHKDVKVFRNYIKADSLKKAEKMLVQKSAYFM